MTAYPARVAKLPRRRGAFVLVDGLGRPGRDSAGGTAPVLPYLTRRRGRCVLGAGLGRPARGWAGGPAPVLPSLTGTAGTPRSRCRPAGRPPGTRPPRGRCDRPIGPAAGRRASPGRPRAAPF